MRAGLAVLAFAAVGLGTGEPVGAAEGVANPPTVRILASSVDPPTVTVAPGDTVVWINESGGDRSIVANDASFDSGTLEPDDRFQFAFTEPRTVTYTVSPGPGVTGTVVVTNPTDPTAPVAPPAAAPTEFAYTGAGAALTGLAGALTLALGAGLVVSARRLGVIALTSLGFLAADDLLPTRRHRRVRREQARRRRGPRGGVSG
jgi:plastocyanin